MIINQKLSVWEKGRLKMGKIEKIEKISALANWRISFIIVLACWRIGELALLAC